MGPKYIPSVFDDLMNSDLGNGPERLRVRRLEDNSDTPVLTIEEGFTTYKGRIWGTHGPTEFQCDRNQPTVELTSQATTSDLAIADCGSPKVAVYAHA